MQTFAELVMPVLARHNSVKPEEVLALLGDAARGDLAALGVAQRAALVDRLVRSLRGLSVTRAPELERELLRQTGAEPSGQLRWELRSASGLVELRAGVRYLGIWLGYGWAELSRLQAAISGLARWVQSSGSGALSATVGERAVRFELLLKVAGHDRAMVAASPTVRALGEAASALSVAQADDGVEVSFLLTAR